MATPESVTSPSATAYCQQCDPDTCSAALGSRARLRALARSAVVEIRAMRSAASHTYSTLDICGRPSLATVASTPCRDALIRRKSLSSGVVMDGGSSLVGGTVSRAGCPIGPARHRSRLRCSLADDMNQDG